MLVKYEAYDRKGNRLSGTLEAPSPQSAEELLWKADLMVTEVKPVRKLPSLYKLFPSLAGKAGPKVIGWARQLATLVESGVSLLSAMEMLKGEQANPVLRDALGEIIRGLQEGQSLSDGLARYPHIFPGVLIRFVRIGEQTGELATMMRRAADYLELQAAIKSKLISSLIYPAIVIATSSVSVYILMTFTIPMLAGLLEEFNTDLPLITRIVVAFGNFTKVWGARIVLSIAAMGVLYFLYRKRPGGKARTDKWILLVPLLGNIIEKSLLARVAQTISTLMFSGIPLLEAVELARDNTENLVMRKALTGVREDLLEGSNLSAAMARSGVFPSLIVELCSVGEQSGNLAEQLTVVSNILQGEYERAVSGLIGFIEPLMIIMVGGIVGIIGVTVISTVYSVLPNVGK